MISRPPAVGVPVTILVNSAGIQVEVAEALASISPEQMTATIAGTIATLAPALVNVETAEATLTAELVKVNSGVVSATSIVSVIGDVSVEGAMVLQGDMDVTGATELEGAVVVGGLAQISGMLDVGGAATVAGPVTAAAFNAAAVSAAAIEVVVV